MSERKHRQETVKWAEEVGEKLGFLPDTVLGIYDEMANKNPNFIKDRTISFLVLYSEGRNEEE